LRVQHHDVFAQTGPADPRARHYPVRAEASSPGGTPQSSLGPLSAQSGSAGSAARAAVADFSDTAVISTAKISSESRSDLEGGKAIATAATTLTGVALDGGVVTIDSIITVATASTDGSHLATSHQVRVEGLKINGQEASIDEQGVKVGNQTSPNPATGPLDQANSALNGTGIQLQLIPTVDDKSAGQARVQSGSLVATWVLQKSGGQGPGGGNQQFTVSLGGATARAQATTAAETSQILAEVPSPPSNPAISGPEAPAAGPQFAGGVPLAAGRGAASPVIARRSRRGQVGRAQPSAGFGILASAHFSRTVSGAAWLVALIGALVVAVGLKRLRDDLFGGAATTCINEQRTVT
jgi:hypothetical protein